MTTLHQLLTNVAIVAISMAVWIFMRQYVVRWKSTALSLLMGTVMTVGLTGVMLLPVVMPGGPLLDLRYTFIGLAGFFGGPVAVALPTAVAIALRAWFGGTGLWVGIPLILLAATFGLIGYRIVKGKIPRPRHVLSLAAAIMISGTIGFFVVLPPDRWPAMIAYRVLPLGTLLFLSTTIAAMALANEMRRQHAVDESHLHRAINRALPDCLNAKDLDGRFIVANPATAHLFGVQSVEDITGKTEADFYDAETSARFRADDLTFLRNGEAITTEQRIGRNGGDDIWLSTLKAPLYDDSGALMGIITHNREITQQKHLEMQLSMAQSHLADALSSMADGLVMYSESGNLLFCNEQYRALFPLTADIRIPGADICDVFRMTDLRGEDIKAPWFPNDVLTGADCVAAVLAKGEQEVQLSDGRFIAIRPRRTGEGSCLVSFSDVTKARRAEQELMRLNAQLEALANTDGLTGLLNRRAFDRSLEEAFVAARRQEKALTLLLIDIDNFKAFNDTYGHPEGDACLKSVCVCLRDTLKDKQNVLIARYGGEEIALILPGSDEDEAYDLAQRLRIAVKALAIPHSGSAKGVITISVGLATRGREGAVSREDMLRVADECLYAAKAAGRDWVASLHRMAISRPATAV